jgi:hypothetical protein
VIILVTDVKPFCSRGGKLWARIGLLVELFDVMFAGCNTIPNVCTRSGTTCYHLSGRISLFKRLASTSVAREDWYVCRHGLLDCRGLCCSPNQACRCSVLRANSSLILTVRESDLILRMVITYVKVHVSWVIVIALRSVVTKE